MIRAALVLVPFTLAFTGADAAAQRPARSGFWAEIGGGPSHIRIACTGCPDVTRRSGSGGYFRMGGAVSSRVMIGVESYTLIDEAFGFDGDDPTLLAENSSLAAVVLWYPWGAGVSLKGGVGFASGEFTVEPEAESPVHAQGIGVGMTFGLGYDLVVWRSLSLTASAATWVTAIGDVVLPARTVDDVIATMYGATLGLTLR